jgi:hypothetical protein
MYLKAPINTAQLLTCLLALLMLPGFPALGKPVSVVSGAVCRDAVPCSGSHGGDHDIAQCESISSLVIGKGSVDLPCLLKSSDYLIIENNAAITNLDGLSNLTSVNTLFIRRNEALTNLDGLSELTSVHRLNIIHNAALTNLDGLSNLKWIGFTLTIRQNAALTNLDGLSNLKHVAYMDIRDNAALSQSLVDAFLEFHRSR